MPRIRTIKPEFWDSPGTARASLRARLFYIALWNWADDYGVGTASPKQLIGFAFPNDDDVTVAEFPSLRTEVSECFGTVWYEVDGRPYYAIPSWDTHQKNERRAKGKHPRPDQAERIIAEPRGTSVRTDGSSGTGTGEQGNRGTGEQDPAAALPEPHHARDDEAPPPPEEDEPESSLGRILLSAGVPPWMEEDFLQELKDKGAKSTTGMVVALDRDGKLKARVQEWQTERDRAAKAPKVLTPHVTKTKRGADGAPVTELCGHDFEVGRCPECRALEAS